MAKHVVATLDELPPGSCKIVEVAGRSIGVYNLDGELFALLNRCPHQGGPLCLGKRYGALRSERPGEYEHSRLGEFVRCPWHGWEFDIRTGQSWFDPDHTRVRSYDVEVQPGGAVDGRIPGPYVAETYPVSVEQDVVVVELGPRRR